jgi:hypothetical protein
VTRPAEPFTWSLRAAANSSRVMPGCSAFGSRSVAIMVHVALLRLFYQVEIRNAHSSIIISYPPRQPDGHEATRLQQISTEVSLNGCDAQNVSHRRQCVNIQCDCGDPMPLLRSASLLRYAGLAQAGEIG